jgi:hypothetical protein
MTLRGLLTSEVRVAAELAQALTERLAAEDAVRRRVPKNRK